MKKTSLFILSILLVAACSKESGINSLGNQISLKVSGFPQYTGTKTVGVEDEGKTQWESGDQLFLILGTESDSLAYRYRLTYSGSGWNTCEQYADGKYSSATSIACGDKPCRAEVYYAPSYEFADGVKLALKDDLTPGVDEYLVWTSGDTYYIDNTSTLSVVFVRKYSRIRISANAGYTVKLTCASFVPVGYCTSALSGYPLYDTANSDANAFFYGTWAQGADISFMTYDTNGAIAAEHSYENRDASVNGQAYAVYCIVSTGDDDTPGGGTGGETVDDNDADDYMTESDFTNVISVAFSGTSATVSPENILPVKISGAHVVLGDTTSSAKNVKLAVSGSTTNGSLKVYNQKKMLLSLEGASITSTVGPAINNQCGKRVYVKLTGTNSLTDAATYTDTVDDEDSKACFFSEGQLIFSGEGSLTVKGNYKHGIASDDYVRVLGGNITVSNAASDGIKVNEYYRQDAGTVVLNSVGDAIQCDDDHIKVTGGKLTANTTGAKGSGLQAVGDITISGGEISSTVSGNGSKCIKTDANLTVSGGTITLKTTGSAFYDSEDKEVSSPACIRVENTCTLNGGTISCTSSGKAGKGINAYIFRCNEGADLTVSTSGSSFVYSNDYSYAKGIKGSNYVEINGGKIKITTTGSGAEGLESKDKLVMNGGRLFIKAYDDAINAAGSINFNGGYTFAYSTKNDAIDSNYGKADAIVFNGGVVMAFGTTSPEEGIDADNDAYLTFSGGTVFSSGGKQGGDGGMGGMGGMGGGSSSPSCSQSTILLSNSLSTGYFTLTDESGNVVMSFYVPRAMNQNYSFISSPLLKSGTTYKYGTISAAPTSAATLWETWYYASGTASVSAGNFSGTGAYQSIGSGSGGSGGGTGGGPGGGGWRPW